MGIFNKKQTKINDPLFEIIKSYSDTTGEMPLTNGFKNSAVFAAVNIIAGDLSTNRIAADSDFYETLINDKPNANTSGYDLKQTLFTNLLLYGNAYALINRSKANNSVQGIQFIPYGNIRIEVDLDTQQPTYTWLRDTGEQRLNADEVLHFKLSPIDGVIGVSPLAALVNQRQSMNAANDIQQNYFDNATGNMLLTLNAGAVDGKAKEHMRQEFENANSGDNAGRVIVVDQTATISQMPNTSDQNIVKLIDSVNTASKKDIASVYGIPVDWLGIESQHNNNDQSKTFYIEHALSKYMDAITAELNLKLGSTFKYDLSKLLNTNIQVQSEMAIAQLQSGLITQNEARQMLNLPPVESGNKFITVANTDNQTPNTTGADTVNNVDDTTPPTGKE